MSKISEKDIEKLKGDLAKRLFNHLDLKLDPTTKVQISSTVLSEILHCVADYVYESKFIERIVSDALKIKKPDDPTATPDFIDDLSKI